MSMDAAHRGNPRRRVEAILQALRTGEASAAFYAGRQLADDVRFTTAFQKEFAGRDTVVERLTGQWPITSGLGRGNWDIVEEKTDLVTLRGDFAHVGAAPADYSLTVGFDEEGMIATIEERMTRKPAVAGNAMSAVIRRRIDRALADGNAMSVAFCDADGRPSLSLRGSLRTYSDRELSLWARNAEGGLVAAVRAGRPVAMLYRDVASRTTMSIEAIGRMTDDADEREMIFSMIPEVEQTHDLGRQGAALIFTVRSIKGMAPEGFLDIKAE
jgi:hypothetical protein